MSLPVVRHVDGDLAFDRTIDDGGAALADGSVVYQFDSTDDPAAPATFVGISGSLGSDATTAGRSGASRIAPPSPPRAASRRRTTGPSRATRTGTASWTRPTT